MTRKNFLQACVGTAAAGCRADHERVFANGPRQVAAKALHQQRVTSGRLLDEIQRPRFNDPTERKRSSGQVRYVRMLGLCLVAAVAVAALAATSASALPEWGQCVVQEAHEGKYTDANCTKKAKRVNLKNTGEFEFKKGPEIAEKHFAGGNVGSGGVLTTTLYFCTGPEAVQEKRINRKACEAGGGTVVPELKDIKVECESEVNKGEAAGTKEVKNVVVFFKGCKIFGSAPCSNTPNEGEIQVNPLKGSLGYINKTTKEVGVLLEPLTKKGEFAKFSCAGVLSTVVGVGNATEGAFYTPETTGGYDGIISPITPVNTMSTEFTQVYTVNEETLENIPSHFAGKHIELLEDYTFNAETEPQNHTTMWSPAGETITNVNHQTNKSGEPTGEKVEIKA